MRCLKVLNPGCFSEIGNTKIERTLDPCNDDSGMCLSMDCGSQIFMSLRIIWKTGNTVHLIFRFTRSETNFRNLDFQISK